jgi:hypothetical protein
MTDVFPGHDKMRVRFPLFLLALRTPHIVLKLTKP